MTLYTPCTASNFATTAQHIPVNFIAYSINTYLYRIAHWETGEWLFMSVKQNQKDHAPCHINFFGKQVKPLAGALF